MASSRSASPKRLKSKSPRRSASRSPTRRDKNRKTLVKVGNTAGKVVISAIKYYIAVGVLFFAVFMLLGSITFFVAISAMRSENDPTDPSSINIPTTLYAIPVVMLLVSFFMFALGIYLITRKTGF